MLPLTVAGWETRDEPVADTVEMKRAVTEMLNFDEAIVRTYRRGDLTVSVYVAYWRPAKVHPRLVAQHTPDVCWTGAGWQMSDPKLLRFPLSLTEKTVPGNFRVFEQNRYRLNVVYWHLIGGGIDHATESQGMTFFRNLLDDLREKQREQYFIRISHNLTDNQVSSEALFSIILEALRPLGLVSAQGG
jgi:EpsI family protein